MGFGLLFLGYFTAFLMSFNKYGWAFRIVGFYLIFLAVGKLAEYKRRVTRCLAPLILMTLCEVYHGVFMLGGLIDVNFVPPALVTPLVDAASVICILIFHVLLLLGIRGIAADVGDSSVEALSGSGCVIVGFYTLADITTTLLKSAFSWSNRYLVVFVSLFRILYPLFILYLFYRCYAGICAPEDADMKPKPSRFAFINKSRALSEKQDREMEGMIADMQAKKRLKKQQKKKK